MLDPSPARHQLSATVGPGRLERLSVVAEGGRLLAQYPFRPAGLD